MAPIIRMSVSVGVRITMDAILETPTFNLYLLGKF